MISYAFVNSSFEPIYSVEQGGHIVNECKNICNDIINDIDHFSSYYENVMFESEIFGMSDENVVMLESEKKNIFENGIDRGKRLWYTAVKCFALQGEEP